jgi:hypothetical protein
LRFVAVIARRQDIFHRFPGGEPEMGVWGKKTGVHLDNLTHDVFGNEEKMRHKTHEMDINGISPENRFAGWYIMGIQKLQ